MTRLEIGVSVVLSVLSIIWIVAQLADWVRYQDQLVGPLGGDFHVVREAALRWWEGGSYYQPGQLAGPYTWIDTGAWMLYPPPTLLLFLPFVWLPEPVWWIIPLGITIWAIIRHRPRPLAWGVIAFCLTNPTVHSTIFWGNPGIWFAAALALATHYQWPAVLIFMKPSLFPFALFGVWKRSWWLALVGLAAVSLLFLPMWQDYIKVVLNARPPGGVLYNLAQVPVFLIPLAAWFGRQPRARTAPPPDA